MKVLTKAQIAERMKDRTDYRRALIQRRESSSSRFRQLAIDVLITKVEHQIWELKG